MNNLQMNDGNRIPQLGMGVYLMEEEASCVESLKTGLSMGYRMIDTAAAYMNEAAVGRAVRESGIPRDEIFVSTKLWVQDYGRENASHAIDRCLERLQMDYIDLLFIHRPAGDNIGAYQAMEDAYRQGKVKSVGICNHTVPQLERLLKETTIVPAVNQMECHPLQQEKELRKFLKPKQILLESWFPLGHGSKRLSLNENLNQIAEVHQKSVSQIILRWHIQEGFVVIPKSTNPEHMKENMEIFDFSLTNTEMEIIRAMDQNRYLGGDPEAPANFQKWESIHFAI